MENNYRPSRFLWLLGVVLLLVSLVGTGLVIYPSLSQPEVPRAPDPPAEYVPCFGHVDVEGGLVSLFPVQPGRVVEVAIHENESVKKDAVLIRVDDRLAKLRVEEAKAALDSTQTQLALARNLQEQHTLKVQQQDAAIRVAQEGLRAGEFELQRTQKLFDSKNVGAEVLAVAKAQVEKLKAAVQAEEARKRELESHQNDAELALARAKAEVAVVKSRLEQSVLALKECTLIAPEDGKILRLQVAVGDLIGSQALQPAILFLPNKALIVRAEVMQEFASQIREGQEVTLRDDGDLTPVEWHGMVQRVSDWYAKRRSMLLEPGQMNDVRTLECIIKVNDNGSSPSSPLRIGQRLRVSIQVKTKPT